VKRIFVTGTPGALTAPVVKYLAGQGYAITWPNQDLAIANGRLLKEQYYKNIELELILHHLLGDRSALDTRLPDYFDIPYPGPKEYLKQFPDKVVLNSVLFAPFLQIWANYVDAVIDIRANYHEDIKVLNDWTANSYPEQWVKDVLQHRQEKYLRNLKLFCRVCTLTNAEIQVNRLDRLIKFLA